MRLDTRDKFWEHVQQGPWKALDGMEKEQLNTMLTSAVFKHAVGVVWEEAHQAATSMLGFNLATPDGINKAAQMQGKALGMTRVIEGLIDLVEDDEEEEDNG